LLIGYKLKYVIFTILHQLQYIICSSDRIKSPDVKLGELNCSWYKLQYIIFIILHQLQYIICSSEQKKTSFSIRAKKRNTGAIEKFNKFSPKKNVAKQVRLPSPHLHITLVLRCLSCLWVSCSHSCCVMVAFLSC
jgi:hypothetical protein